MPELAAMFREHRVSAFPVTAGDGTVIGVVSESDLLPWRPDGITAGTAPARPPQVT